MTLPFLVDSHCHLDRLDLTPFNNDLELAIANAQQNGVGMMLCVCINMENYPEVLAIAQHHDFIYATVGVHPNDVDGHDPDTEELVQLAADEKVIGIGETGLDYFRSQGDLSWQQERFRRHIRAAKEIGKPLIIHSREASQDTLRIMREEEAGIAGGVMHCFVDDLETARQAMDMGFFISFSGIVTFKNATELQEVAKQIPSDRLLVETDAPYLAPVPYRGKSNQPAWVRHVAEYLAQLRGVSIDEIAEQTTGNFHRLFKI
jgi:TatD DNase family protein